MKGKNPFLSEDFAYFTAQNANWCNNFHLFSFICIYCCLYIKMVGTEVFPGVGVGHVPSSGHGHGHYKGQFDLCHLLG